MALNTKNRVKNKKEFDEVFKRGKTVSGSFLFVRFIKSMGEFPRFGFIISSKISKKAVIRNRIKRLLSETSRLNLEKIRGVFDVITVLKTSSASTAKPDELRRDFLTVLNRAGIL
ncbi:MAG: ribonuclease P protein component [Candidatus Yanofskybacteria bacterium RIFCSPHIGHO2_01_FULL_44_22]|uniref:Ribonuclease P protein component n=1 Tax=Candidatus Yanofskybacteria bacterium RIFCSPHIGHO2_01_FULL_44_22 TaxID=1802669 RepID=A0A1F8EXN7_9BACT|nr:MAG: ribonuclease P protein component [Candidatus Yanofskybacteria bacterium RIFCSPHIGHO2_01_FULL_44_22]